MPDQEWTVFTQSRSPEDEAERKRREAEKAARREAEEKARWIAQRRAEDRAAARKKLLQLTGKVLAPLLLLALLVFLGYPGYRAYEAADALERGDYAKAVLRYRQAGSWSLFDALFHANEKADQMEAAERLAARTAGVADSEIPKGAVKLSGASQGRSGPVAVEVIADSKRIYQAQSAAVDLVAGATLSSRAICDAVSQALSSDKAWAAGIYPWTFGAVPPMPSPSPTPGPKPEELKVFFYDTELEEDFTEQVDEVVRLKAVAYPEGLFDEAIFTWSIDDPYVLKLSVSKSTRECEVRCLANRAGYVTLRVECNGVSKELKVYTRN